MKRRDFVVLGSLTGLGMLSSFKTGEKFLIKEYELIEPERKIIVTEKYDVIIAGGGAAGVAAAYSAAVAGARVLLIEKNGCLGGVMTSGMLTWLFEMKNPGFCDIIKSELDNKKARIGNNPDRFTYHVESMKLILEELCEEAGVDILLHTSVCSAYNNEQNKLEYLVTESKSGRQAWQADAFIDATGDGDLAGLAGCSFEMGREENGEVQPMTFMGCCTVNDVNEIKEYISFWQGDTSYRREALVKLIAEFNKTGVQLSYGLPTLFHQGGNLISIMINHEYGAKADSTSDITRATLNGRKEVNRAVNALQKLGGPFEGLKLVATAEHIGVREGRRIKGLYTVTKEDLINSKRHDDAVCSVRFGVDIHTTNPDKGKTQEKSGVKVEEYDIPYRALVAKDVNGLLMAGRCISGDFYAHASYRTIGTVMTIGQAAGKAACFSAKNKILPSEVNYVDMA